MEKEREREKEGRREGTILFYLHILNASLVTFSSSVPMLDDLNISLVTSYTKTSSHLSTLHPLLNTLTDPHP